MITIYGTHCPRCKVIEKKLQQLEIDFELIDDVDEVTKFGMDHNVCTMPIVVVDGKIMDFAEVNKYLSSLNK